MLSKTTATIGAAALALQTAFTAGAEARDRRHHNSGIENLIIPFVAGGILGALGGRATGGNNGGYYQEEQDPDYGQAGGYGRCMVQKYQYTNQGERVPAGTEPCEDVGRGARTRPFQQPRRQSLQTCYAYDANGQYHQWRAPYCN